MELNGFSPGSFEQFIRTVAIKIFGPGVTVFGNGPDGGREATFKGEVPFPFPPATNWIGYGVVQAKFKEKLESTKIDNAWARKQLEDELKAWSSSSKRNPKPEYYIFCTNVDLTSAAGGGKELLRKILDKHKLTSSLKDYAIWDGVQLKAFIDSYQEIRNRYICYFTTGDLLYKLSQSVTPDSGVILTSYICKELSADEDAKLSQAGDRSEDRIRLANVFVDLPSSRLPSAEPSTEEILAPASVARLLKASELKLDPLSLYEQRGIDEQANHNLVARYLFLGGPGSGKSTIGQYLSQIHRAALLDRLSKHRLEPRILNIIEGIKESCKENNLDWPKTPRFPFKVDLNSFAKSLTQPHEGVKSLSDYLRRQISNDYKFSHENFSEWLKLYPSLLILDGLDEVPSSSNRRQVVQEIQIFLHETRNIEANLMIIASSRPEGYGDEFNSDEMSHRYLTPLSRLRAMECAKRYVSAKIGALGEQRSIDAYNILNSSLDNPLIARLMRSPLQVTFMVTVVAASGKPSESRWQLFNDYYRIIYERELHKAVRPFDQVLSTRRQDIDALHHKVGFILQCRAELTGNTQADLSSKEFECMVLDFLEEAGLDQSQLEREKEMILGAANIRLVFLTSRTPGRLSFDVRSLQEYMAAACMTGADISVIIKTLELIAHSRYWRNTILFAIGRFFSETHLRGHRDQIRLLCENLNLQNDKYVNVKIGSGLALDILESGAVEHVPNVSRSLANCALSLLGSLDEDEEIVQILADVYNDSMHQQYLEHLQIWLGQSNPQLTIAAWLLILSLEKKGNEWTSSIIIRNWPTNPLLVSEILKRWLHIAADYEASNTPSEDGQNILNPRDTERLSNLILHVSPNSLMDWVFPARLSREEDQKFEWLEPFLEWASENQYEDFDIDLKRGDISIGCSLTIVPLPRSKEKYFFKEILNHLNSINDYSRDWLQVTIFSRFYENPCASSLSMTLKALADSELSISTDIKTRLSWPLQLCLAKAKTSQELLELAERISQGEIGDFNNWEAIQKSWESDGIDLNVLATELFKDWPTIGSFVNNTQLVNLQQTEALDLSINLSKNLQGHREPEDRKFSAWLLGRIIHRTDILLDQDPIFLKQKLLNSGFKLIFHIWLPTNRFDGNDSVEWIDFFDCLGNSLEIEFSPYYWHTKEVFMPYLENAYEKDNRRSGILRLIAMCSANGIPTKLKLPISEADSGIDIHYCLSSILLNLADATINTTQIHTILKILPFVLANGENKSGLEAVMSSLESYVHKTPQLHLVVTEISKFVKNTDWTMQRRLARVRQRLVQNRPSGFDENCLRNLRLPLIAEHAED